MWKRCVMRDNGNHFLSSSSGFYSSSVITCFLHSPFHSVNFSYAVYKWVADVVPNYGGNKLPSLAICMACIRTAQSSGPYAWEEFRGYCEVAPSWNNLLQRGQKIGRAIFLHLFFPTPVPVSRAIHFALPFLTTDEALQGALSLSDLMFNI